MSVGHVHVDAGGASQLGVEGLLQSGQAGGVAGDDPAAGSIDEFLRCLTGTAEQRLGEARGRRKQPEIMLEDHDRDRF